MLKLKIRKQDPVFIQKRFFFFKFIRSDDKIDFLELRSIIGLTVYWWLSVLELDPKKWCFLNRGKLLNELLPATSMLLCWTVAR